MSFRRIRIVAVAGLLCAGVVWGLLAGGCNKKPNGPEDDCPELPPVSPEIVSDVLLTNPVYSPIDSCIYYVDSGEDSVYFEEFKKDPLSPPDELVVEPGIYRLRLNSDDPAELVAPNGFDPDITPDGSTMYYHPGSWGGPLMKVQLPDGEPELVKDGCFIRACWFSPDTLVVGGCDWQTYFLDLVTDSLHLIEGLQFSGSFDVGPDKRIAWNGVRVYDPRDSTQVRITEGGSQPRWSPSGQEIVSYVLPNSGGSHISVTDLEGNQQTLAIGGGPYDLTIGSVFEPDFTSDGQFVIYIMRTTPLDYDPCRPGGTENLVRDGQIWIMSAADGSDKRQVSTWSRIRP